MDAALERHLPQAKDREPGGVFLIWAQLPGVDEAVRRPGPRERTEGPFHDLLRTVNYNGRGLFVILFITMDIPYLVPGTFVQRDNRFRATVLVGGQQTGVFVPNSGRLTDLFTPDRAVWLHPAGSPGRKTEYDLKLVEHAGELVSVDARLPNPLFAEYLQNGGTWFDDRLGEVEIQREVTRGESRLDFKLQGPQGVCWVETKSITLVEGGIALFPDAPTRRGRRHVVELLDAARKGEGAAVVFVVQRADAESFSPHHRVDPQFAQILRQAEEGGVEVRAHTCRVSLSEITIENEIPCIL